MGDEVFLGEVKTSDNIIAQLKSQTLSLERVPESLYANMDLVIIQKTICIEKNYRQR
jgi:hypothetical protein